LVNKTGSRNTAIGFAAMLDNEKGDLNTAIGQGALQRSFAGDANTATGAFALDMNGFGSGNTATGNGALFWNLEGNNNTAIGAGALLNLGVHHPDEPPGNGNIALGIDAGRNLTTGNQNIDIGNAGVNGDSATIRIGAPGVHMATFIHGISGKTSPGGVAVFVNGNGKLGTMPSSARFKEAIKPLDKASEAILALKPVTFHYKKEVDPDGIPQFGLVAEQVEKVSPDLVARDEEGKVYTVRYDAVNAMLLNEFLKEHRKVEQLEKQIEALTAGLQKVSAQLEASKPAPQVVNNP
jgi:hypothetical protein